MTDQWIKGSCLCGDISYKVKDIGERMGHCHCSMCRKFHGAAYATFGEVSAENFVWTKGESQVASFKGENGTIRKFCPNCGSSLIFEASGASGEIVEFALATLDDEVPLNPDAHIYTDYKASWAFVDDGLPCYHEGRDGEPIKK
ncbi:GFA family protein [Terasakiella sp. A23]|uniref:GFA family protein n=1 Tax=Terasakiella sp. FCG-A23 TaxID=3080561 RepID=UPI002953F149|nr:GFA family protein [Terasakiella sp. A23]MDV7341434.1 GFA family protein [Terasakiella sp. A23]